MKKIGLLVLAALALAGTAQAGVFSEEPAEFSVQGRYWFPGEGDFDLFGSAYGAQLTWREWVSFPFGVGLNLGLAKWDADAKSNPYKYRGLGDFDGDVTVVPVGLSLAYCLIDWNNWAVNLDTGLHYVFVQSDADCRVEDGTRHDLDMDNAVWWTVGAEFDYQIDEGFLLTGGAGFQTDVLRSETECNGAELRDTRFQAFFVQLGAKFLF